MHRSEPSCCLRRQVSDLSLPDQEEDDIVKPPERHELLDRGGHERGERGGGGGFVVPLVDHRGNYHENKPRHYDLAESKQQQRHESKSSRHDKLGRTALELMDRRL